MQVRAAKLEGKEEFRKELEGEKKGEPVVTRARLSWKS